VVDVFEPTVAAVSEVRTFLLEAWKEAGPEALGWTGATEESIEEIASEAFITALLSRPMTIVLAAQEGGRIVGVAVLRGLVAGSTELAGIIVLESRTGGGVGSSLITAAKERAQAAGAKEIVVKTEAVNDRAVGFYQHHGFRLEKRARENVHGTPVDLVTLRMKLAGPVERTVSPLVRRRSRMRRAPLARDAVAGTPSRRRRRRARGSRPRDGKRRGVPRGRVRGLG